MCEFGVMRKWWAGRDLESFHLTERKQYRSVDSTVQLCIPGLIREPLPKSWGGWSPPGNQVSCVQVKSTTALTTAALTSLPPGYLKGWKTTPGIGMNPCSDEHAWMLQWFPSLMAGHTSTRAADLRNSPPPCGTNSSSSKGSHRPLLPSTLSRSNCFWVGFGFFFFFKIFLIKFIELSL